MRKLEKELLAVVFALNHESFVPIQEKALLSAPKRLPGMLLRLQRYNYQIIYRPGKDMYVGDTMSRAV